MSVSTDVRSLVWTRTTVAETVLASMTEYREQVGARIRQLRLARGLTQDQLADMVGVQEKTVSRWEKGRHSGYMSNIKALAAALEVDQEEITGTPPAPLGLGARAEQIDDGFEEFRAYVTSIERRLLEIDRKVDQILAAVRPRAEDEGPDLGLPALRELLEAHLEALQRTPEPAPAPRTRRVAG